MFFEKVLVSPINNLFINLSTYLFHHVFIYFCLFDLLIIIIRWSAIILIQIRQIFINNALIPNKHFQIWNYKAVNGQLLFIWIIQCVWCLKIVFIVLINTKTTFNFNFEVYQALNSKITYINKEKWSINSFSLFNCQTCNMKIAC